MNIKINSINIFLKDTLHVKLLLPTFLLCTEDEDECVGRSFNLKISFPSQIYYCNYDYGVECVFRILGFGISIWKGVNF
jgi:hypothetical protein